MHRAPRLLAFFLLAPLCFGLRAAEEPTSIRYSEFAVSTDHALATAAAEQILAAGGSAADAAGAAMLALGVAGPGSSGFGGGGFALYYRASDQSVTFLDFRETAPGAATPDMFTRPGVAENASQVGGLASGVPGEPAGIAELVSRFGRRTLAQVAAPAIALARRGVPVTPYVREQARLVSTDLARDRVLRPWASTRASAPTYTVKQPDLARTLATYARLGPRAVYEGTIGQAIVRANRARGGIMTREDLAAYRVITRAPLETRALGHRFVSSPPPSAGGYIVASSLAMLASRPMWELRDEAAFAHALVESWKGPFADRTAYFGDPGYVDVRLDALSAAERRSARARVFDSMRARPASDYALPLPQTPAPARAPDGGGTSHLCIVDAEGNVASVTTTVNLFFGARYSAAGFVMNDEMDDFARAVGATNAFGLGGGASNLPGPGRRPVSSMTPSIIFDDNGPVLCIGAAGGSRIPTATEQVALRILVGRQATGAAIRAPRIHHQGEPATLRTERFAPASPELLSSLAMRGHTLELVDNVAVVSLVRIVRTTTGTRLLMPAADPRKGGTTAGR